MVKLKVIRRATLYAQATMQLHVLGPTFSYPLLLILLAMLTTHFGQLLKVAPIRRQSMHRVESR